MDHALNKAILLGNLERDPEIRYSDDGMPICSMRLATMERYRNANGETVERTEWHNVVAWDRLAEICHEYLRQGSKVYIEGALQTISREDSDGAMRYATEIRVRDMVPLDSRGESGLESGYSGGSTRFSAPPSEMEDSTGFEPDDDFPF